MRGEIHVQLALFHYFGHITTLTYSKYSSLSFAQRRNERKFRLLSHLHLINHLFRKNYHNTKWPISNLHDVINHFVRKRIFTQIDCSQFHHCVQIANGSSVPILAFIHSSRTYEYKRLAMGLSKSVTGCSSFIRHFHDGCLTAGLCTQFMVIIKRRILFWRTQTCTSCYLCSDLTCRTETSTQKIPKCHCIKEMFRESVFWTW